VVLSLFPHAASAQWLAIGGSPRTVPTTTMADWQEAEMLTRLSGANATHMPVKWSEIELSPGRYDFNRLREELGSARDRRWAAQLTLDMINTTKREVPADLAGEPWHSERMQARFTGFLDALATAIRPFDVRWIAVGNEIDIYFASHGDEIAGFYQFFQLGVGRLHQARPGVLVGTTVSFDGFAGAFGPAASHFVAASDILCINYYPGEAAVNRPDWDAAADFDRLIAAAANKPILLQEFGLPSSELRGSSEALQAKFVGSVMAAWETRMASIPFISYIWMHDLDPNLVEVLVKYYQGDSLEGFREFLATLGLRRADGTPKAAWPVFQAAGTRLAGRRSPPKQ